MEEKGWVSFYRKILDNPTICKDSDYFAVWGYLLLNATHDEMKILFQGEEKTIKPGQLITGRKKIAEKFNINESKVQRILKTFENEHQIEQQKSNKNRLITIVNWNMYQTSEQQNKQQVNNNRTTNEQQVNTNNNDNNVINNKKENIKRKKFVKPTLEEVKNYCKERNNSINPISFINYYESNGWMIGKNPMKDWKACVRSWETKDYNSKPKEEKLPDWFGKEIEKEQISDERKAKAEAIRNGTYKP